LSAAESLASGLPMALTSVLPGQEEANARHLIAAGAAIEGGAAQAALLLLDRRRLGSMRAAAAAAGRPWAAARAVAEVGSYLGARLPAQAGA
jgi:processive 1,2-diacylglycerol beta-glucosyltransferase